MITTSLFQHLHDQPAQATKTNSGSTIRLEITSSQIGETEYERWSIVWEK